MKEVSIVVWLFRFEAKCEVVVLLELGNLFEALSFYKLADSSAIGDFEEICFEIVVGKSKVEKLLRVFLHLFEFELDQLLEVFANVWAQSHIDGVRDHFDVILDFVIFVLFEKSHRQLLSLLRHSEIIISPTR